MKLKQFEHLGNYVFALTFNNGEFMETALSPLI